jgi:hypothetical protein
MPRDEQLIPQVNKCGIEIGEMLLQMPGQKKIQEQGMQIKLRYLNELVMFLERKEKWDRYIPEVEELCACLQAVDGYQNLEDIRLRVFSNTNLPNEYRH